MPLASGTAEVGGEPAFVCGVPENGVRVRNLGGSRVFFGGPDVAAGGGYPLEPGEADTFPGVKPKESPVVPAPDGDLDPPGLYGVTAKGDGISKVAWIAA